MKKSILFTAILVIAFVNPLMGQNENCATVTNLEKHYAQDPSLKEKMAESELVIQEWLQTNSAKYKKEGEIITIPVVFHIIHDGEDEGIGNNIGDETVLYQLERLNEDFRKMNADTLTPSHAFYADQADSKIEFCLAKRDEMGNATTGITRHDMDGESWTIAEIDVQIKPKTIWNKDNYINIWCVNLVDASAPGVDGYATFLGETTDTTDGVVVANFAFGYSEDDGKTIVASHEMGHYLNLFHIWGDDECGDDLVDDTPVAEKSNEGCPTFPHNVGGSCSPGASGEMYMNYMDYSDASCCVMFSNGQKDRMNATLATLRSSLTTSNGCAEPDNVGIAKLKASVDFNVYPNPTSKILNVEVKEMTSDSATITLYNRMGIAVNEYSADSKSLLAIDLDGLPQGVYFIKLQTEEYNVIKRVILKE